MAHSPVAGGEGGEGCTVDDSPEAAPPYLEYLTFHQSRYGVQRHITNYHRIHTYNQ